MSALICVPSSGERRPRPPSELIATVVILGPGVLAAGAFRMPPRAGSPVEDTFHQTGEARLESASGFGPSDDARRWRSTPPITVGTKVPMIDDQ